MASEPPVSLPEDGKRPQEGSACHTAPTARGRRLLRDPGPLTGVVSPRAPGQTSSSEPQGAVTRGALCNGVTAEDVSTRTILGQHSKALETPTAPAQELQPIIKRGCGLPVSHGTHSGCVCVWWGMTPVSRQIPRGWLLSQQTPGSPEAQVSALLSVSTSLFSPRMCRNLIATA